jgi:cytochrome c-type biogenesis protein CcmH
MITFVIVAAAMVAVALAWVLVPLLRRQAATGIAAEASNLAVLRDQRSELDADLANGVLTKEAHEQAVAELTRRAAEDTRASAQATGPIPLAGAWTAAIVAGALPLAAMVLYVALGGHAALTAPPAVATGGDPHDLSPQKVAEMAASLAAKLEKDPSNAQGWVMLAHTYYSMKRFAEATKAYERAVALVPGNADLLADYADALGATQQGLEGKPLALVERALEADPNQWKALALAGTAAFDRRDYKQAVAYWERLQASVPPDSQIGKSIAASIAEARSLGNIQGAVPAVSAAKTTPAPAAAAATAAPSPPTKAGVAPAAGAAAIAGTISLSPKLAANAGPDDPVFIFARPAQGPKMPLAVMRKKVRDLPATFSLDDSMAMAPEMKLSNFAEIVIGARVAKSGNAAPQSGDLEGFSQPVKLGAAGVAVVIDTPRP